jgi:hypothetical protein
VPPISATATARNKTVCLIVFSVREFARRYFRPGRGVASKQIFVETTGRITVERNTKSDYALLELDTKVAPTKLIFPPHRPLVPWKGEGLHRRIRFVFLDRTCVGSDQDFVE